MYNHFPFIVNTMTIEDCVLCVQPGRWAAAKVPCQPGSNMFSTMNSSVKVIVWQAFYKEL